MARGVVVIVNGVRQYEGNITNYVVVTCLVAAMGGLLFGYDSGGVITRGPVLKKFFPSAFEEEKDDHEMDHGGVYCKSDGHQLLTLFTSSLYIAALVSSFIASSVTRAYGRNISMCLGAYIYFTGTVVSAAAIHTSTLIIGRILLGLGVGFTIQSILIYISEMAPPKFRGALNVAFQMAVTIGILVSNFVNYGTAQIKGGWGWRLSFALAVVPALMLAVGSIFLPDTPNSMLERDQPAGKAKKILKKIRGTSNIELEFQDLAIASEAAKKAQHPWKTIWQRRYRPHLVMCILIPFFQQLTGINAIMFYAPVIFKTLGLGDKASLLCSAIIGAVNAVSTCVSIAFVDTCGRRPLFLEGGVQMCICQVAIGILIGSKFAVSSHGSFSESEADLLVIIVCCYVAAFAWSWGPLGWLVPSEICPLEIRSAGHALNVSVNMLFTFGITQTSLTMLCHFKCGLFFFFAGFLVIMTVFVYYFLPETMNVPIEDMNTVWKTHWFWGKYIPDDADDFVGQLHAGISRGGFTEGERWSPDHPPVGKTLPSPRL